MAARGFQLPPEDELLALAADHSSFRSLSEALGLNGASLAPKLGRTPALKAKVAAALKQPSREPIEPVDEREELKSVALMDENRVLRRQLNDARKSLASQQDFFDRIVDICKVRVDRPTYAVKAQSRTKPANSVIAPIYDCQFGQFVRPTDTPGNRGSFSVDVFDARLKRWVEGVCGVIARRADGYRIDELFLPFGGDQVEGDEIFGGQAWQLEIDPMEQMFQLAVKFDSAVRRVVKFAKEDVGIPRIAVYGVTGNHGKVGGKRGGARPRTYSWDYGFLRLLEMMLRAEPIDQFAVELGGALFFRAGGHEFQMIHGDEIRGWGGLPFYGLSKFDGRSMRLHNRAYRYLLMGHHHQPAEIPNGAGETIVSGDWVGANNLSGMITAASRPQQKVLFVSEKWGVAGTERIYFAEAEEAYAPTRIHEVQSAA